MALDSQHVAALHKIIPECKTADQYRFGQRLARLKNNESNENPESLVADIEASYRWVLARRDRAVDIAFPPSLPVSECRDDIASAISDNQVVIVAGETGSGKTTQLPKICLSLGLGQKGLIGHTQPRRIAARSVANRIAEELKVPLGDLVGYQIRFNETAGDATAIKLMTDGILLIEIQNDRYLNRYDTIIIDEAHERSLNIDFLLGYLKQLLPKRPDLKVIITSATIDVEKFSTHFNDAPIIEVSGRTFPVETLYRPLLETDSESQLEGIVNAIEEITTLDHQGDILVFLSGERDIREAALRLRREKIPHLSVVPLYARLSVSEQNKIFQPHRGRRDHQKYLTLIDSIALLHQYQREIKSITHDGRVIEYVEVTVDDIALANELAHEILGRSLDELPPQTRKLLKLIQSLVTEQCEQQQLKQKDVRFSRLNIRDFSQWSDGQLKIHCKRLEELEYLLVNRGSRGQAIEYELYSMTAQPMMSNLN